MAPKSAVMTCRICGSANVVFVAHYQPYLDYATPVHDCRACGCRFAEHDPRAHERLHALTSTYDTHGEQGETAARYFAKSATTKLRRFLVKTEKHRFVIDFLDGHPELPRLAEIGCSRGYLSSYFIAQKRDFHGFDISETAVREARRAFGDHFHVIDDTVLPSLGEFDAIFHTGTIGCVGNPVEMTHRLLSAVKPGGYLLFNAPVREHLEQTGALWLGTPPPDLVTIFPLQFWRARFGAIADVSLSLSYCSWFEAALYRRAARRPAAPSRNTTGNDAPVRKTPIVRRGRRALIAGIGKILHPLPSSVVRPYGAHVVLKRKD